MNGAADLGGMMGFGSVIPEPEDERFHADWERRALALVLAMGAAGRWSIDASRFARESLPPSVYLSSTYYAIWTMGLERLAVAAGLVGADELEAGRAIRPGAAVRSWNPDEALAAFAAGSSYARPTPEPPRFSVGDAVRTRVMHPVGHTRLPRYARGKAGVVGRVHGAHVLPDANAHGAGEQPQWLYSLRFTGRELWGPDADPTLSVTIDAWESYLEAPGNSGPATVV
ncbi:MAG: nitrile hydratase subunit beta [Pseudonocardiales bacterium]|nr:nitrile hydratase subunit beta [Pseudonocardiales bacterium]